MSEKRVKELKSQIAELESKVKYLQETLEEEKSAISMGLVESFLSSLADEDIFKFSDIEYIDEFSEDDFMSHVNNEFRPGRSSVIGVHVSRLENRKGYPNLVALGDESMYKNKILDYYLMRFAVPVRFLNEEE